MSHNGEEGECKDDVPWHTLPRAPAQTATPSGGNLKPAPQEEALQGHSPLSQADWVCIPVCGLQSAPEVIACHAPPLRLLQSWETRNAKPPWPPEPDRCSRGVRGVPLGCHYRN